MIDTQKLQRVAQKKGIGTFYQLAKAFRENGHEDYQDVQAQRLWDGSTDPKLSTIDRLCDVLDCEIAEITSKPSTNGRKRKKASRR